MEKIEDYAFVGCRRLTAITIPNNISVNELAFYGCDNLTSICWNEKIIPVVCRNGIIMKKTAIPKLNKYWDLLDVLLMVSNWGMGCLVATAVLLLVARIAGLISAGYCLWLSIGFMILDTIFFVMRLFLRKTLSKWICVF